MGFLTPRNLLQDLVLYVHRVVLDCDDGKDLYLPNATKSNLLDILELKLSSSSSLSNQTTPGKKPQENVVGICASKGYLWHWDLVSWPWLCVSTANVGNQEKCVGHKEWYGVAEVQPSFQLCYCLSLSEAGSLTSCFEQGLDLYLMWGQIV